LILDPDITEIMVNASRRVFIERAVRELIRIHRYEPDRDQYVTQPLIPANTEVRQASPTNENEAATPNAIEWSPTGRWTGSS